MTIIYGVDTDKPFTPVDVREAIIGCFIEAHGEVLEQDLGSLVEEVGKEEFEKMKEINIRQLVRNFFEATYGDFENPTKEALIAVCDKLADFAKSFRQPEIIKKHYGEIMQLVNKLEK